MPSNFKRSFSNSSIFAVIVILIAAVVAIVFFGTNQTGNATGPKIDPYFVSPSAEILNFVNWGNPIVLVLSIQTTLIPSVREVTQIKYFYYYGDNRTPAEYVVKNPSNPLLPEHISHYEIPQNGVTMTNIYTDSASTTNVMLYNPANYDQPIRNLVLKIGLYHVSAEVTVHDFIKNKDIIYSVPKTAYWLGE